MEEQETTKPQWHLEKSVPVALISGLVVQLVVLVWMASKYDSRILDHDQRISRLELHEQANVAPLQALSDRLARIEGKIDMFVITKPRQ